MYSVRKAIWMLSVVLLLLLPPYLDTVYVVAEDEEHFSRISLKETTEKVYSMYDKNSRPPGYGATDITMDIYVISLSEVSEKTMDFTANMYIRQRWNDQRLANSNFSGGVLLTNKIPHTWIPDTFIKNDKISKKSEVTTLNTFLRVDENGDVLYSLRVTSTISCPMQLKRYPFDEQNCTVLFESYGHSANELTYTWNTEAGAAVELNKEIELPEHQIDDVQQGNCTKTYNTTGAFSCVSMTVKFQRRINYYIMGLFVPSILIVLLSWVAFWIDKASTPGRVSLSLLTILTMTNQMSSALSQLPKVSYIKLVDVWLTGCLLFVFGGFLEYALVNKLATDEKKKEQFTLSQGLRTHYQHNMAGRNSFTSHAEEKNMANGNSKNTNDKDTKLDSLIDIERPSTEIGKKKKVMGPADKVDYFSRFLFPLMFLVFNLILWCSYLLPEED